ncbi:DNA-binding transcriptional regulator OxyR [Marinicauda salina]|uniref:DNA-binding transcriptional regulator OxyR n=1 Tax=Marinicauda salina TaxID=2135793 RepID=A0A2U2BSK1_9PROT|nr:LysR substrate-binding domain-containing protein [Marinicauda salina]PWE16970.1 DNA-binding transcriptional regulator OxyR [Marinicauda salina]
MRANGPTLRQLRYLLALEAEGTFRRAAEACGVSQPSLSEQIGALEAELGLRLAERSRPKLTLTPAGREIADRARRVLQQVDELTAFAAQAAGGFSGTLKLGATFTAGPYLLPRVVARLHSDYPDLRLYVRESTPARLVDELLRGEHDLILTQLPVQAAGVEVRRVLREPLRLAVAADHRFAGREAVDVSELTGEPVITLSPEYLLHHQIRRLCEDVGARLLADYQGTSLDAVRQMVGMGMGASLLPALYVASEGRRREEVAILKLTGREVSRAIGLVWRQGAAAGEHYERLAELMRDVVRAEFDEIQVQR